MRRLLPFASIVLAGACASAGVQRLSPAALPFAADTVRTERVRDGVAHHFVYSREGPWAIHVLDVRLDRCYTPVAVKGGASAVGRRTTSDLLRDLARSRDVVGGVNADFFRFAPPGVPTGAHVSDGRVITPPTTQPVFAVDSAGRPHILVLAGDISDSLGLDDPRLSTLRLRPIHPREAVGGRPRLTRDSAVAPAVRDGSTSFITARHPRTAVGIVAGGSRLLLVTVDGRQPAYSAGMTLPELARLMLALGAPESLNLDGGGSTALVLADPDSAGALRVANRPSDPQGERAVGNALGIVRGCAR